METERRMYTLKTTETKDRIQPNTCSSSQAQGLASSGPDVQIHPPENLNSFGSSDSSEKSSSTDPYSVVEPVNRSQNTKDPTKESSIDSGDFQQNSSRTRTKQPDNGRGVIIYKRDDLGYPNGLHIQDRLPFGHPIRGKENPSFEPESELDFESTVPTQGRNEERYSHGVSMRDDQPNKTNCKWSWRFKLVVLATAVLGAIVLVVLLIEIFRFVTDNIKEGCHSDIGHLGSKFTSVCRYQRTTFEEVRIVELMDRNQQVTFSIPSISNLTENTTFTSDINDWTMSLSYVRNESVQIQFSKFINNCRMMRPYDIKFKNETGATLKSDSFNLTIADDFEVTANNVSMISGETTDLITISLLCEGRINCESDLGFDNSLESEGSTESSVGRRTCNSVKTEEGRIHTSCTSEISEADILDKNSTLKCNPRFSSTLKDAKNANLTGHLLYQPLKEMCKKKLQEKAGHTIKYTCSKRISNNGAHIQDLEVLRDGVLLQRLYLGNSNVGTTHPLYNGRFIITASVTNDSVAISIVSVVYYCDGGLYAFKFGNKTTITFELIVLDSTIQECRDIITMPWQARETYTCQICSENDLDIWYERDDNVSEILPASGMKIRKTFDNGLIRLNIEIFNVSCEHQLTMHIGDDTRRAISLITNASIFGTTEMKILAQPGLNGTVSFYHNLGCYGQVKNISRHELPVLSSTPKESYTREKGLVVTEDVIFLYSSYSNGSVITSRVTYYDSSGELKISQAKFTIFYISDDFCLDKKPGCNYYHPTYPDRFVSCMSKIHPREQHCVKGLTWKNLNDCHGTCE